MTDTKERRGVYRLGPVGVIGPTAAEALVAFMRRMERTEGTTPAVAVVDGRLTWIEVQPETGSAIEAGKEPTP